MLKCLKHAYKMLIQKQQQQLQQQTAINNQQEQQQKWEKLSRRPPNGKEKCFSFDLCSFS